MFAGLLSLELPLRPDSVVGADAWRITLNGGHGARSPLRLLRRLADEPAGRMRPGGRTWRALSRRVRLRRPHGLVSWRYLRAGRDARIAIHRRLWWESCRNWPRPLWGLLQLWLWSRWLGWYGWRASWVAVRRFGPEVRAREGLSLARQAQRTLTLSLGWCIPPGEIYALGLYRRPDAALDYVFSPEVPAFQAWCDGRSSVQQASLALLQDKAAFAAELGRRGVPVVPTLAVVPAHTAERPLAAVMGPHGHVFCKTRSGSKGEGAFAARRAPGGREGPQEGLQGRWFEGDELEGTDAVEAAWRQLLARDDALVQPRLVDHPGLAPLSDESDVVTVRFISRREGASLTCLSATLEVPWGPHEITAWPPYVFLPVEAETGRLLPFPADAFLASGSRERLAQTWQQVRGIGALPFWSELVAGSLRAHRMVPGIWAVAWDWVITPDGPVLLEGNSGWWTVMPQVYGGGLLRGGRGGPAAS